MPADGCVRAAPPPHTACCWCLVRTVPQRPAPCHMPHVCRSPSRCACAFPATCACHLPPRVLFLVQGGATSSEYLGGGWVGAGQW